MRSFVLASASPRRRDILKKAGYNFVIVPSNVDETITEDIPVEDRAEYLAVKKAQNVYEKTGEVTLGADTIVVVDGGILGKPHDRAENERFLRRLSGSTHVVITGFCIIAGGTLYSGSDKATVHFRKLSDEEILSYVESGSGLDKAGGYGIQDEFDPVAKIDGEFDTVVGLPMKLVKEIFDSVL